MSTYTTGHGPIIDKGGELFYTDSGPIPGSTDYKTIIIFHGSAFTGRQYFSHLSAYRPSNYALSYTLRRRLPMAAAHNLRLVIPNRRDLRWIHEVSRQ